MTLTEEEYLPCSDKAYQKAQEEGLVVVLPQDNELFIDIDTEEAYERHCGLFDILSVHIANMVYKVEPSKSGLPHRHITITMPDNLTIWQRLALQAALGSDIKRELLGCIMVFAEDKSPIMFLEKGACESKQD